MQSLFRSTVTRAGPRCATSTCASGPATRAYSRTCGLVGMPNVGKSTLFNALCSQQAAQAENYPFCTIDPNTALVDVPDKRLTTLQNLAGSAERIPARIEFNDIAGLVKGASAGAGLGNRFLSHIRQVSVLLHVVRCFEDPDIIHVEETVDPLRDIDIIETELVFADLESVERQLERRAKTKKKAQQSGGVDPVVLHAMLERCAEVLGDGRRACELRQQLDDPAELLAFDHLGLLSAKPQLFVCNVAEDEAVEGNEMTEAVHARALDANIGMEEGAVVICSRLEEECASLDPEGQVEMLGEYGLNAAGLDRVVESANSLLGLYTFYTVGPKEAHAWALPKGSLAPQAAGTIHSDFERGFIRAETIAYEDYVACGSEAEAKANGKMRVEGKEYVVNDGDIFVFRYNV